MRIWDTAMKVGNQVVFLFERAWTVPNPNFRFPDRWQKTLVEKAKERVRRFAQQGLCSGQEEVTSLVLENITAKTLGLIAERVEGLDNATFGSLDPAWLLDTLLGEVMAAVRQRIRSTQAVEEMLPHLEQKLKDQVETWLHWGAKWWVLPQPPTREDAKALPEGGIWLIPEVEVDVRAKITSTFVVVKKIILEGEVEIAMRRKLLRFQDEGYYRSEVLQAEAALPLVIVTQF